MSDDVKGAAGAGPSHRSVESGLAVFTAVFALVVIYGSILAGIDWGIEGPRAGFFPFYIGLFILVSSAVNFIQARTAVPRHRLFAEWGQLRQVMAVVVPSAIYVALVPAIGIYVASTALIAFFMKWLGRYGWGLTLAISVGTMLATFLVFELWFLVPLPKGPLEDFLGY
jgi:hypothetical protein